LIVRQKVDLSDLSGKSLAVDANNQLHQFLCEERGFSRSRVETVVRRLRGFYSSTQSDLSGWVSRG